MAKKTINNQPKIDSLGMVEIVATKSPYMKQGKEYKVSKQLAETLVKKGSAIYK